MKTRTKMRRRKNRVRRKTSHLKKANVERGEASLVRRKGAAHHVLRTETRKPKRANPHLEKGKGLRVEAKAGIGRATMTTTIIMNRMADHARKARKVAAKKVAKVRKARGNATGMILQTTKVIMMIEAESQAKAGERKESRKEEKVT